VGTYDRYLYQASDPAAEVVVAITAPKGTDGLLREYEHVAAHNAETAVPTGQSLPGEPDTLSA
jgi:hypothetical protein